MRDSALDHTYRLHLPSDGTHQPRIIEFEANGPAEALQMAQSLAGAKSIEMFEDGRKLANLQSAGSRGFWIVSPA